MNIERTLYRGEDVREFERRAIEIHGIPATELMERAGAALFRALRTRFPWAGRVLVLCGGGNNGGDGYVLARLAKKAGLEVKLCVLSDPARLRGAAAEAAQEWRSAGGVIDTFDTDSLRWAEVVVDALLGTGLDRAVEGEFRKVIEAVNRLSVPVISADVPSGLNADTGAVMGYAIKSDLTVTFIGCKAGLFTGRGPEHAREVVLDVLAVPQSAYEGATPRAIRMASEDLSLLPRRERDAHKGQFGHVFVVGGGAGMPGAARLASEAALRGGAGRVSVAGWPGNVSAIAGSVPEVMCHGIENGEQLANLLSSADVLAVGPGLGRDAWAQECWQTLQRMEPRIPAVFDADALNWLADERMALAATDVITPHPGEAARLLGCTVAEIEQDRIASVRRLAESFGAVAVLKGAGSLVAAPDGRLALCDRGTPAMASAGMGDLLTGLIAAFLAQGMEAFDAARLGVLAHAVAGERAARGHQRGVLAGDLFAALRDVINMTPGNRL